MKVMASILYCQKCATPHETNYSWITWQGLRLDSLQCKEKLIRENIDIIKQQQTASLVNKKIAKQLNESEVLLKSSDDEVRKLASEIHRLKYQSRRSKKEKMENLDKYVFWKPKKIKPMWFSRGYYKKNINCPSCNKIIPKTCRKCSYCLNYTKPVNFDYPTKDRNTEIVSLLSQGIYTLQEVGDKFGFSRERTRQIYFKLTGKKYTLRRKSEKHLLELKCELEKNNIKFNCKACNKPQSFKEAGHRYNLCLSCRLIQIQQKRDPYTRFICKNCKGNFNPQRNWKSTETKPQFCTMSCYLQSQGKSINIKKSLDKRYGRQRSLDSFYFRYKTLNFESP